MEEVVPAAPAITEVPAPATAIVLDPVVMPPLPPAPLEPAVVVTLPPAADPPDALPPFVGVIDEVVLPSPPVVSVTVTPPLAETVDAPPEVTDAVVLAFEREFELEYPPDPPSVDAGGVVAGAPPEPIETAPLVPPARLFEPLVPP